MNTLRHFDIVRERWGDEVAEQILLANKHPMSLELYLKQFCVTCGGNWGSWFLSGVKKLWPMVYEAIPDDMGYDAFGTICHLLGCLSILWDDK